MTDGGEKEEDEESSVNLASIEIPSYYYYFFILVVQYINRALIQ